MGAELREGMAGVNMLGPDNVWDFVELSVAELGESTTDPKLISEVGRQATLGQHGIFYAVRARKTDNGLMHTGYIHV